MKAESLKINFKEKSIKAKLNAYGFKDGEFYILYIPSLEISAYGDDFKDAYKMAKVSLKTFSEDLFSMTEKEARKMLEKLGWKKSSIFKKKLEQTKELSIDSLKNEYELPQSTNIRRVEVAI